MEILCDAEYGFMAAANISFRLLTLPGFLLQRNEIVKESDTCVGDINYESGDENMIFDYEGEKQG